MPLDTASATLALLADLVLGERAHRFELRKQAPRGLHPALYILQCPSSSRVACISTRRAAPHHTTPHTPHHTTAATVRIRSHHGK